MTVQKTHQYKIFTSSGVYLGLLPNVTTPFTYNLNIATAFTQIQVNVAQSADIASQAVDVITDENSNPTTDEAGNQLTTEGKADIVGSGNSNTLIQNNNQIQVWEFSKWHPNGILVFTGYISKWKANFGSSNDIQITCISNGQDLNNYLVPGVPTVDQSQTIVNDFVNIYELAKFAGFSRTGQTFTTGAAVTKLSAIEIWAAMASAPQNLTLSVWPNAAAFGGTPLATATVAINSTTMTGYTFTFSTPLTVSPNTQYFFSVVTADNSGNGAYIYLNDNNAYAGGTMWEALFNGVSGGTFSNAAPYSGLDLAFSTFFNSTSSAVAYTNDDPTFILNDIMKNYIAAGGQVAVPAPVINQLIQVNYKDATLPNGTDSTYFAQTFTPKTNMEIDLIQLYIGLNVTGPITYTISLIQGDPTKDTITFDGANTTTTVGAGNVTLGSNITGSVNNAGVVNFLIPQNASNQNLTLTAGVQYYIALAMGTTSSGRTQVYGASTGEVATDSQVGRAYIANLNSATTSSPALNSSFPYMYFSLGLIKPFPQSSSLFSAYGWTFNIASYTFKLQTVLQAIQILAGLSPVNWYWYVDPGTNILYFAQANTTADFTIIKGRHINNLDIEATKETIKNVVYFSGGDDGTGTNTNILVQANAALSGNRVGLAQLSDNRVSSSSGGVTVAKLIALEYLNDNAAETYITTVTILDSQMDTSTITLGMVAGFSGFGNFVDRLLLQVVGIGRSPDQVTLQLGVLPPRPTQAISQLQAQLASTQTANTNATPS